MGGGGGGGGGGHGAFSMRPYPSTCITLISHSACNTVQKNSLSTYISNINYL